MSTPVRVLLVDHNTQSVNAIMQALRLRGEFDVHSATSQQDARFQLAQQEFDLILLALSLPKAGAVDLAEWVKSQPSMADVPILFLESKSASSEKSVGLVTGGYERTIDPMNSVELLAHMMIALRSRQAARLAMEKPTDMGLSINATKKTVRVAGKEMRLSTKEFDLLALLLRAPGEAVSREDIAQMLWEKSADESARALDVHIWSLRSKLGQEGRKIETVGRSGYRFKSA